jgi:L-glyceraldehyde 3-phosphate reductase
LAQGLLTTKYLNGIPDSSRAMRNESFQQSVLTEQNLSNVRALNELAKQRGQSLAQMAIAWVLKNPAVTSALVGASSWPQIEESLGALRNASFTPAELERIDAHARDGGLNIWAASSQSG